MVLSILLLQIMISQTAFKTYDFSYDYALFQLDDTSYALKFYYQLPYSQLFFLKHNDRFMNRYRVSLQLMHKKELVTGQLFTREITVDTYDQTRLPYLLQIDSINFKFTYANKKDAKLNAKMKFDDLYSAHSQDYNFSIDMPSTASRPIFYTNQTINPQRLYRESSTKSDTINIFMQIYAAQIKYCSLWITKSTAAEFNPRSYRKPKKERQVTIKNHYLAINDTSAYVNAFYYSQPAYELNSFGSGSYTVKIYGYNQLNRKIFETATDFTLETSQFENNNDYYDLVDKLVYLTTEQEMKKLKQTAVAERESVWQVFWKKYDPTPTTEINERQIEYFEQIDYCIENFSRGDRGYRSQRAQVYMKYGLPDYTESRPFERYSNPLEIWYYYNLGKKYVFIDYHGFGEYTLYEENRL